MRHKIRGFQEYFHKPVHLPQRNQSHPNVLEMHECRLGTMQVPWLLCKDACGPANLISTGITRSSHYPIHP